MPSVIEIQLRNAILDAAENCTDMGIGILDVTDRPSEIVIDETNGHAVAREQPGVIRGAIEYGASAGPDSFLVLRASVFVMSYKLDLVLDGMRPGVLLAIECDGHDWHDRTKQQASGDRARDRALLTFGKRGIPTIRFTGSDIHHNAHGCAIEAIKLALLMNNRAAEEERATEQAWHRASAHEQSLNAGSVVLSEEHW